MEANPKFVKLLESVSRATREGKIEWVEIHQQEFRADLGDDSLSLNHANFYEEGPSYYSAYLFDKKGRPVDQLSGDDEEGKHSPLLQALFELAKRRARKIDDLLDTLISNVNARKPSK